MEGNREAELLKKIQVQNYTKNPRDKTAAANIYQFPDKSFQAVITVGGKEVIETSKESPEAAAEQAIKVLNELTNEKWTLENKMAA